MIASQTACDGLESAYLYPYKAHAATMRIELENLSSMLEIRDWPVKDQRVHELMPHAILSLELEIDHYRRVNGKDDSTRVVTKILEAGSFKTYLKHHLTPLAVEVDYVKLLSQCLTLNSARPESAPLDMLIALLPFLADLHAVYKRKYIERHLVTREQVLHHIAPERPGQSEDYLRALLHHLLPDVSHHAAHHGSQHPADPQRPAIHPHAGSTQLTAHPGSHAPDIQAPSYTYWLSQFRGYAKMMTYIYEADHLMQLLSQNTDKFQHKQFSWTFEMILFVVMETELISNVHFRFFTDSTGTDFIDTIWRIREEMKTCKLPSDRLTLLRKAMFSKQGWIDYQMWLKLNGEPPVSASMMSHYRERVKSDVAQDAFAHLKRSTQTTDNVHESIRDEELKLFMSKEGRHLTHHLVSDMSKSLATVARAHLHLLPEAGFPKEGAFI